MTFAPYGDGLIWRGRAPVLFLTRQKQVTRKQLSLMKLNVPWRSGRIYSKVRKKGFPTRCASAKTCPMNPQIILSTIILTLLAFAPVSGAATKKKTATTTFTSPAACNGAHGAARWAAKTDPSRPPAEKSQITAVTPSQMYAWAGVGTKIKLGQNSKRIPAEQKWYVVTGLVDGMKVEADGDIHID